MDELQAVREMRPSAPEPDAARLAPGRRSLLAAAAGADARSRSGAPRWLTGWGKPWRLAIPVAVAASVVAGALVVAPGDKGSPQKQQVQTVTVAQVMERAAESVRHHKVIRPRPDQWIYSKMVLPEPIDVESETWERFDGKKYAERDEHGKIVISDEELPPGDMGDEDLPSDDMAGTEPQGSQSSEELLDNIAKLPTDPRKLLEQIRSDTSFDSEFDTDFLDQTGRKNREFRRISNILLTGSVLPPELNATLYRALALIPGVEVLEQRVDDAAGRSSLAIRSIERVNGKNTADYLFLDPKTYAFRGAGWDASVTGRDPKFGWEIAVLANAVVDKPGQTH
ncbi:CU044_5270 family protein [Streptomyces palmae]|uniref:CU044_5270 family protein n=1 Tax=Streptomyces palmae TaxID=1701085 RepID=A0A4Z0GSQ8_9ACTN|nr:CU044_5270 family protein [Streptomyces palmae]TGA99701.1 hypothetical protein E4099_22230 [Streptomyces palmae]